MAQFTAENARLNALKSVEARRRAAEERQAQPPPAEPVPLSLPQEATANGAQDGYVSKRLVRTRELIERLENLIRDETDPARLDKLASALSRASELERNYAGRPLPGSLRPAPEVKPTRGASLIQSLPPPPANSSRIGSN